MKIAILTGGGDSSGMNSFIRGVVRSSLNLQPQTAVWGVIDGWKGTVQNDYRPLTKRDVAGIGFTGGTILGTVRFPELSLTEVQERAAKNLHDNQFDFLFVCGGNGSTKAAHKIDTIIRERGLRTKILVAPGSIDNDVCNNYGTSIGFYSALDKSLEMLEWIRDTASAHRRVYLIKSMGRMSAYLAFYAGITTGAEYVIIPDETVDFEKIATLIDERERDTRIIIAEGYEKSVGEVREILEKIFVTRNRNHEIRTVDMSYFQRGGKAAVTDILRASWLAFNMVRDAFNNSNSAFYSVFYTGQQPTKLPLEIAADDSQTNHQTLPNDMIEFARSLR